MTDVEDELRRWISAGVLEETAAGRIREFERMRHAETLEPAQERPTVLEALLYLGVVVLGVGVFSLIAQQWGALESWARVATTSVPVALLLLAGLAMRTSDEPALQRGGQAAWLVAVAMFAGALAVIVNEYGPDARSGEDDRAMILFVASATIALALGLWVTSPSHLQIVAVGGSAVFLAEALGNFPDDFSATLAGVVLLCIGVAGLALGEADWLSPRMSVRFVFAVLTVAGPFQAGVGGEQETAFELLTFVMAAGVLALGVVRGSFALVVVGVLGMFIALVTFIFEHFEEQIGAPVALMLSGALLVAAVLLLARFRSERGKAQPAGG